MQYAFSSGIMGQDGRHLHVFRTRFFGFSSFFMDEGLRNSADIRMVDR
jgi:hypothetical protein